MIIGQPGERESNFISVGHNSGIFGGTNLDVPIIHTLPLQQGIPVTEDRELIICRGQISGYEFHLKEFLTLTDPDSGDTICSST